jgi:tellurite resistance protein TerC
MLLWAGFIAVILFFLALDLGVFNRKAHVISTREASAWTGVWVSVALAFSGGIYLLYDSGLVSNPTGLTPLNAAIKYLTGYLIELSLSVDNIFVIAVIFRSFKIPQKFQHRVLFWGILGAIVFRALTILFGVGLITRFDWMIYVFGAFLIYTGLKMLLSKESEEFDPRGSWVFRQIRKAMPIARRVESDAFIIRKRHVVAASPLLIALLVIEGTDILFALDSIPAILAITSDPFLVFSSNILAIMGLRSMYFFLANMLNKFHYLKYSLVVILVFVGIKMLLSHAVHMPEWLSLGVIASSLGMGVWASMRR